MYKFHYIFLGINRPVLACIACSIVGYMTNVASDDSQYSVNEKLTCLSELCYQAELLLLDINDTLKNNKRENFRRLVAIHLLAITLNTANSARLLLIEGNNYAAAILVRVMVEQWVNLKYIFLSSNYENLVRYLYDGDMYFIKNVRKAAKTFQEYNEDGFIDDLVEDALGSIKYRLSSSNALRKYGHPLKCMPSFSNRVMLITEKEDDLGTMFLYFYDYLTYSRNVHTSKDKIIEMTYAETYEDWFQAIGTDSDEDAFRMISTCGEIVDMAFTFFCKYTRVGKKHRFHMIKKDQAYLTNILEYRAAKAGHRPNLR